MGLYNIPQSDLFSRGATGVDMLDGARGTNPSKLWLPIWSGEVIHAYDEYNKFEGMVDSRTITSGTTMEFPITGTVALKPAWGAGEELAGGTDSAATTFQIKLDKRPMAAHFELDNIDLMITQWEYRSELARQAGLTLANARDKQIAAYIARAGMEDAIGNDPRSLTPKAPFSDTGYANLGLGDGSGNETDAALLLLKNIEDWMVYLQENDITTEGVYCAVTPKAFASIRALGVARENTDLNPGGTSAMFAGIAEQGGLGSSLAGRPSVEETLTYMGCTICKTNHGPFVDYTESDAVEIGEDRYNLDFAGGGVKAVMWQRNSVASLKLQGLKVDTVDDVRRNTAFTVASVMAGTGVLRPECACVCCDLTADSDSDSAVTRAELRTATSMSAEYYTATGA
jgi:hypothetical protein